jgi:hypothetical protein
MLAVRSLRLDRGKIGTCTGKIVNYMFNMDIRFKEEKPSAQKQRRRCLMCGTEFDSEWPGERICGRCRATAAWKRGG